MHKIIFRKRNSFFNSNPGGGGFGGGRDYLKSLTSPQKKTRGLVLVHTCTCHML